MTNLTLNTFLANYTAAASRMVIKPEEFGFFGVAQLHSRALRSNSGAPTPQIEQLLRLSIVNPDKEGLISHFSLFKQLKNCPVTINEQGVLTVGDTQHCKMALLAHPRDPEALAIKANMLQSLSFVGAILNQVSYVAALSHLSDPKNMVARGFPDHEQTISKRVGSEVFSRTGIKIIVADEINKLSQQTISVVLGTLFNAEKKYVVPYVDQETKSPPLISSDARIRSGLMFFVKGLLQPTATPLTAFTR